MLGEWCRHAHDEGVALWHPIELRGCGQALRRDQRGHPVRGDVREIRAPGGQRLRLRRVDVEAEDPVAGLGKRQGLWQPHIAQADDADDGGAVTEPAAQPIQGARHVCPPSFDGLSGPEGVSEAFDQVYRAPLRNA